MLKNKKKTPKNKVHPARGTRPSNKIQKPREDKILDSIIFVLLLVSGLISIYPFWFVIVASFSNPILINLGQVWIWPKDFTLIAYETVFSTQTIWRGYANSLLYTSIGTLWSLVVTLPLGYALSRNDLPGRKGFTLFFVFTMYFSGGMVPLYMAIRSYKMLNTIWAIILPGALSVYNMLVCRSFFKSSIPEAIWESASIDGCSVTRFFFQFVLPLSKAIIAVMTLFYALSLWNAYLGPKMYLTDSKKQVLQVVIHNITAQLDMTVAESMGASEITETVKQRQLLKYGVVVASILPMMIVYPFVQKYFVQGVMLGAIKG